VNLRRTLGLAAATAGLGVAAFLTAAPSGAGVLGWDTIASYPTHAACDQGAIDNGVADNYRCVLFEALWDLNVPAG
jgi:hypothetical protein